MNLQLDFQILGWLLVGLGVFHLVPIAGALFYGEPVLPYVGSAAAAVIYGLPVARTVNPVDRRLRVRDGFVVVTAGWLLASAFGALPYVLAGVLAPIDALFESVAGFTTTGSTVMNQIEAAPRALLLWRSLTQWLGGMGIIVFTIAVLPLLGIGGMQLYHAEVPSPVKDKLTPRIAATARRLWLVYVGLTVAAVASYTLAGMDLYEAVCHAMTSLSTGGFSTRDASLAAFNPTIQWVAVLFMLFGGTNFAVPYRLLTGRLSEVSEDVELRLYLLLVVLAVGILSWILWGAASGAETVRVAAFQTVSVISTTGYATADWELWPSLGRFVIFHLLLVGGMAGSTSGGLKTLRLVLSFQALRNFVWHLTHPNAVRRVRFAGQSVADDVVSGVAVFLLVYLAIAVASGMIVSAAGYDLVTSLSGAFTALGNVGPALGALGPTETFAHLPGSAKFALMFCMLAGRLEIFTVIVLFEPHFWRR
jgi:trk system potassium uptake protein TrkH